MLILVPTGPDARIWVTESGICRVSPVVVPVFTDDTFVPSSRLNEMFAHTAECCRQIYLRREQAPLKPIVISGRLGSVSLRQPPRPQHLWNNIHGTKS